jgi:integrase
MANDKNTPKPLKKEKLPKNVFFNSTTKNYFIRFRYNRQEFEKVFGPGPQGKADAIIGLEEAKQDIRLAKRANEGWEGFAKLQKAKQPKTFADAAADYMEERANYKASSIAAYNSILKKDLLPAFGKLPLKMITDSDLRKYQVRLCQRVSASRTNTVMQLLRSILSQEYKAGVINRDPSLGVRRMQEDKTKIDPLSEQELELALAHIERHYRPLFTTLAYTGARPNELIALRWSDIDLDKELISVSKGRVRGAEGKPKTKSGERTIPIAVPVKLELERMKEEQTVISLQAYVFTDKKGQPINKHLDRIWERALRAAQLRHRPSYQLRHTFATQCIIDGLPLPYIAKVLGHSTIDTLVRHYAGWIDDATQEHDALLRKLFDKKEKKTFVEHAH